MVTFHQQRVESMLAEAPGGLTLQWKVFSPLPAPDSSGSDLNSAVTRLSSIDQ